jgi:Fibronectin type III domain
VDAPVVERGVAIDAYEVVTYLSGSPRSINVFHSTNTTQTVLHLVNGKSYTFKVAAHNSVGWSALSAASAAITVGSPGKPLNLAATPGSGSVTLTWGAPPGAGAAINGYRVTPFLGTSALATRSFLSTATRRVITGLLNAHTYSFRVAAHNARGWGLTATSGSVTVGAPLAPTGVSGVPGGRFATISWKAPPSSNGSAIGAYRVTSYVGSAQQSAIIFNSPATRQVITGLSRGKTLRFRVEAHNARGWSHKSGWSPPVTPGAPIAPTGVKAVAGTGQAVVSWTAPTIDNGAPVSGYEVVPYKAGVAGATRVFSSTTPSRLITGLVKGQQYTFRVAAKNSSGWGPFSNPSAPITPS